MDIAISNMGEHTLATKLVCIYSNDLKELESGLVSPDSDLCVDKARWARRQGAFSGAPKRGRNRFALGGGTLAEVSSEDVVPDSLSCARARRARKRFALGRSVPS